MENNPCVDCKFAEWARNDTGAFHHEGHGRCTWSATMLIAGSAKNPITAGMYGGAVSVKGGRIDRNNSLVKGCLVRVLK